MITRAVFTYFNPDESYANTAGYRYYSDMLYTMALATLLAMRHFVTVQVVTSSWGARVLREAGVPATEYSTALDTVRRVPKAFWAYGKLIAYTLQTQPFVHVDNDVFLWKALPRRMLSAELCFQSKEAFNQATYKWYSLLQPCWDAAPARPQVIVDNPVTDFTYNCGVCGGHRLEFFREWLRVSGEYILAEANQALFYNQYRTVLQHQNLWHEQYFGASLIKAHALRDKVELVTDDINAPAWCANNTSYTHIWGGTKHATGVMNRVRSRLLKENPQIYNKVTCFVNEYLFNECRKSVATVHAQ